MSDLVVDLKDWKFQTRATDCSFYTQPDNPMGLKVFSSENKRDVTHYYNEIAAEAGIGPEVGGLVDMGRRYGYFVEALRTRYTEWTAQCRFVSLKEEERDNLMLCWKGLFGTPMTDGHSDNFGYRESDGQWLFIDFGGHSFNLKWVQGSVWN